MAHLEGRRWRPQSFRAALHITAFPAARSTGHGAGGAGIASGGAGSAVGDGAGGLELGADGDDEAAFLAQAVEQTALRHHANARQGPRERHL